MSDYKNGKWAAKIIDLQKEDGSWGYFHTLAMPTSGKAIATEQAINRLRRLGFTKDDEPIKKRLPICTIALQIHRKCLTPEKSAWIGIFLLN